MNCVKRFCEQTKKVESYNYNPGTNDRYSHQEYQVKAQCPSCFTDWTRVCNEVTLKIGREILVLVVVSLK